MKKRMKKAGSSAMRKEVSGKKSKKSKKRGSVPVKPYKGAKSVTTCVAESMIPYITVGKKREKSEPWIPPAGYEDLAEDEFNLCFLLLNKQRGLMLIEDMRKVTTFKALLIGPILSMLEIDGIEPKLMLSESFYHILRPFVGDIPGFHNTNTRRKWITRFTDRWERYHENMDNPLLAPYYAQIFGSYFAQILAPYKKQKEAMEPMQKQLTANARTEAGHNSQTPAEGSVQPATAWFTQLIRASLPELTADLDLPPSQSGLCYTIKLQSCPNPDVPGKWEVCTWVERVEKME